MVAKNLGNNEQRSLEEDRHVSPAASDIQAFREKFGLTQPEAAALVHVTTRAWQWWESGHRVMPTGLWELVLIKADLHPVYARRMK